MKEIPEGFHSVTPMLILEDASKAIDFYKQAFGATERYSVPGPEGKGIMHAELMIGDSIIMLGQENPEDKSAGTAGCSPVSFYIYVQDADEAFGKAVKAGARSAKWGIEDMFWGDRVGVVQDPFGYTWWIATHKKDVTPEQMREGAKAMYAKSH